MALDTKPAEGGRVAATTVEVVSPRGEWLLLHDDAKATAISTDSYRNQTQAGARWTPVPKNKIRVLPLLEFTAGGTVSTAPIITIVGYWGPDFDGDFPLQGVGRIYPLHTSITLSGTVTADDADGTSSAALELGTLASNGGDGYDLYGANRLAVFTTQAAVGPTSVDIWGLFV